MRPFRSLFLLVMSVMLVAAPVTTAVVSAAPSTSVTPLPTSSAAALRVARAIFQDTSTILGSAFVDGPDTGTPVADAQGFGPFASAQSFGILTNGAADQLTLPSYRYLATNFANSPKIQRGLHTHDVTTLRVDFLPPVETNCLQFDFAFLTEEYQANAGGWQHQDGFVAELGTSDWTTANTAIRAPHTIAFDVAGQPVRASSTGITRPQFLTDNEDGFGRNPCTSWT